MSQSATLNLTLHPKQIEAFNSLATEILYGGAAGGGKSHLMRVAAITWCTEIPGLQVYVFRRNHNDLMKNHMEGPKGFRSMLAGWSECGFVEVIKEEIRFWNGSKIYLCHCNDEKDRFKYQGAEMHVLLIDELTHFTETIYRFLRNRVRMVGITVPEKYRGRFPRIINGANPGGVGHHFVKTTFVDNAIDGEIRQAPDEEGGMLRQFIRAQLEDNPSMAADDPGYERRLMGLGSEALVKAMRWGDWNVVEGPFFDCWDSNRHVIEPFQIPSDWLRFRSMDWGSASPFSIGWWAVCGDDFQGLPRGCMVRYREWYGSTGKPNEGLRLTAPEVARGIKELEAGEEIAYGVLDPSAFAVDGGPSIAEMMMKEGVFFRRADNKRIGTLGTLSGWDQMRGRMKGDGDGRPMVVCFNTCTDSIRTIPVLQHDPVKPEDLDTHSEDHCFAAGTLVDTQQGPVPIEDLKFATHAVWSAGSWRCRMVPRKTHPNAELLRLTFDNGVGITCTPDHRFMDCSGEWRYAKDLLNVEVSCDLSVSARPSRSLMVNAITGAVSISRSVVSACTEWFGKRTTGQSRKARTYTISMVTEPTTSPRTLSASLCPSTSVASTARSRVSAGSGLLLRPGWRPVDGMELRRAVLGTASITSGTSGLLWNSAFLRSAMSAVANTWSRLRGRNKANSVRVRVKPVRCVSVEGAGRGPVYCLTEYETGAFTVEGGLIVHNCADEWRYACMSRPYIPAVRETPDPEWDYYADDDGVVRSSQSIREIIRAQGRKRRMVV